MPYPANSAVGHIVGPALLARARRSSSRVLSRLPGWYFHTARVHYQHYRDSVLLPAWCFQAMLRSQACPHAGEGWLSVHRVSQHQLDPSIHVVGTAGCGGFCLFKPAASGTMLLPAPNGDCWQGAKTVSDRTSADNWTPPMEPHDPLYETVFGKVTLLHFKRIRWLGKCYPVPPCFDGSGGSENFNPPHFRRTCWFCLIRPALFSGAVLCVDDTAAALHAYSGRNAGLESKTVNGIYSRIE